jgi:hypothetical protein
MFGKPEREIEDEGCDDVAEVIPGGLHYFPRIVFPSTTKVSNVNRKKMPVAMYRTMS